jgi:MoaA/NifB/PqqE/SkfB family radical SAM enzyme
MNILTKALAMARIFYHFKKRSVVLPTKPIRLWIESSLACNLRCVMCPNKDLLGERKGLMSFELFMKIIDETKAFVSDIYLHHRGEPLINARLGDMISYAKQAGITVRFHTNGTLLKEEKARMLLEAEPDLVSISFDGFQKDVYEEVRPGAVFETTVENIIRFAQMKKDLRKDRPYIVIERIDFANYRQKIEPDTLKSLEKRFHNAGIDEVIVKDEYAWATDSAPELTPEQIVNVCTFPWYAMVVCWNGIVTPCPQDYHAVLPMGDLTSQSIQDVWNGVAYQELRTHLIAKSDQLTVCRRCDRLCRKTVSGIPLQYLVTFFTDQFAGYGRLRKWIGTRERN